MRTEVSDVIGEDGAGGYILGDHATRGAVQ